MDPPPPYMAKTAAQQTPYNLKNESLKNKSMTLLIECTRHEPISHGPESSTNPVLPVSKVKFTITLYPSTTLEEFIEAIERGTAELMGVGRDAMIEPFRRVRGDGARRGNQACISRRNWEAYKEMLAVRQHCFGQMSIVSGDCVTEKVVGLEDGKTEGVLTEAVEDGKSGKSDKGCFVARVVGKIFKRR